MVNVEAKKGQIKNDLIFGMELGDTKKDFFDRCWQLNKKGLVMQGPNNNAVQHVLGNDNLTAINMLFYGEFDPQNVMTGMRFEFSYKAWSLWNKDSESQNLFPKIRDSLLNWFPGNEFIPLNNDKIGKNAVVKVDGNRQILAYIKDDKDVVAKIEDLRLKYPEKYK